MMGFQRPKTFFQIQKPMMRVCYALAPVALAAVYYFGWRAAALLAVTLVFGIATEALFTFRKAQPVTSAVFVTCAIFTLSLPPETPFWMAAIGIVVGVALGKMVFGGFGQNVFNPAMVGRCFLYITFPVQLTSVWVKPFWGGWGGFLHWSPSFQDAVTRATPLAELRSGDLIPVWKLFIGNVGGSLGETSALLIILGGLYIVYKKAAPWRLALSCLIGGIVMSGILHYAGLDRIPSPLSTVLAGSFLFGTAFVVTEPVSGPNMKPVQWIYGFMIGSLTVILRGFSNFSEGIMFSVLIMNAFVPLMDQYVGRLQQKKGKPA